MSRSRLLHRAICASAPPLVLAIAAASALAAEPTWTTIAAPFTAGASTGTPDEIGLIDAPDGTAYATAVYGDSTNIGYVDVRPAGGTFVGAVPAQAGGAQPPTIDFDSAGNALALSSGSSEILAGFRPSGATSAFGAPQTISTAQVATAPSVSVNPSGAALTAWAASPSPSSVVFSNRPAGATSTFAAAAALPGAQSADGAVNIPLVTPILDADGAATIAYTTWTGSDHFAGTYALNQVSRPAGGAFSATSQTIVSGIPAPHLAENASGDAVALWQDLSTQQVKASYRPHGGTFGAPQVVASAAGSQFSFQRSSAAVDASGRVLFAFDDQTATCASGEHSVTHLFARSAGAAGTWGSDQLRDGEKPIVGLAKDSNRFVLLYSVANASGGNPCVAAPNEVVAALGENGVVANAYAVMPGGSDGFPTAATRDSAGNALVIWRSGGATGSYHAAALDSGAAPTPSPTPTPTPSPTATPAPQPTDTPSPTPVPTSITGPAPSIAPAPTPVPTPAPLFTATSPSTVRTSNPQSLSVDLGCSAGVTCTFSITAIVTVGAATGSAGSAARVAAKKTKATKITLPKTKVTVRPGKSKLVKITIPKKSRAAIASALKARKPVTATITVTGNGGTRTLSVAYKRK